jgi:hypothetical protein
MNSVFRRVALIGRRPLAGPILFGLVFGGIPNGLVIGLFGKRVTVEFEGILLLLSLFAVPVTVISAVLSVNADWKDLLHRAFFTSLASCVPIPTIVISFLLWNWGYEVFDLHNCPFFVTIFVMWSGVVTLIGWLVALRFSLVQRRHSRS